MNHFTFMFTSILFHVSTILEIILINDMWIFAFLLHPYILQSTPGNSTVFNLNLLLTQFPSDDHFPHNFTLHNSTPNNANFFLFPLKVRIIGSRLYLRKGRGVGCCLLRARMRFKYGHLSNLYGITKRTPPYTYMYRAV